MRFVTLKVNQKISTPADPQYFRLEMGDIGLDESAINGARNLLSLCNGMTISLVSKLLAAQQNLALNMLLSTFNYHRLELSGIMRFCFIAKNILQ